MDRNREYRDHVDSPDGESRGMPAPRRTHLAFERNSLSLVRTGIAILVGGSFWLALLTVMLAPGLASAEWAELYWDDGDLGTWGSPFVTGFPGDVVAVGFEAPEWARFVTGARFYVCDDQVSFPWDPEQSTSHPFRVRVWRASGGLHDPPGEAAMDGVSTSDCSAFPSYTPEDAWLDVELDVPLHFEPGPSGDPRIFFVGMEWQHRLSPFIGRDINAVPPHYTSWKRIPGWPWELRTEADIMVRAIVSDESGNPLELATWGRVKAAYAE